MVKAALTSKNMRFHKKDRFTNFQKYCMGIIDDGVKSAILTPFYGWTIEMMRSNGFKTTHDGGDIYKP